MARKRIYPPSVTPGIPKSGDKPEGWIETTLGEVLQVVERKAQVNDDTEYQLVTARRNRGGIVPRARLFGRDILTKTQFFIQTGDFLISKRQIIHGACGVVPSELDGALVSNEYTALRVRKGLLLEFLDYFCHTVYFQQTCFQSSVGVDVEKMIFNFGNWLKYKVHLPSIAEQAKIVEILSTWTRAIALTEQRIEASRQRKKALMQRILTGEQRFSGFEQQRWQEVPFSEVLEISIGRTPSRSRSEYWDVEKKTKNIWLSISDLSGKQVDDSSEYISDVGVKSCRCKLVPAGTVVMSFKLTIGRPAILARPAYTNEAICSLVPLDPNALLNEYLYHALGTVDFDRELDPAVKGKTLNQAKINRLKLPLPSLTEQHKIAEVLDCCDQEADLYVRKLEALQRQKKGLMQQLLTGRLRVRV